MKNRPQSSKSQQKHAGPRGSAGHGAKSAAALVSEGTVGKAAQSVDRSNRLVGRLKPKQTPAEATAEMVVSGLAINAVTAAQFSKFPFGDVDLTECLVKLHAAVDRVHGGDLQEAEAVLAAQAVTLNAMFTHLANLAATTEH